MTVDERIDAYGSVADVLSGRVADYVAKGNELLKQSRYVPTTRDHVLIGLVLKIESSFRALVVDAGARRAEAMHHLKTIVEAYIFLHVVAKDQTDHTAEGLLCRVYEEKAKFYRLNPAYDFDGGLLRLANQTLSDLTRSAQTVQLREVATEAHRHSPELGQWYEQIYRSACEPAHLADVVDFMEPFQYRSDPSITIGDVWHAPYRALFAIEHGLQIMLNLASLVSDNVFKLTLDVRDLAQRTEEMRTQPRT